MHTAYNKHHKGADDSNVNAGDGVNDNDNTNNIVNIEDDPANG